MLADIIAQIPTKKSERFKFTNIPARLKKMDLKSAHLGWSENVEILNKVAPGAEQYQDTQLWNLNTAATQDFMRIDGDDEINVTAEDGGYYSPRISIHVAKGQEITVIETQGGQGSYWKNQVCEIVIEDGAILNHIRTSGEADDGVATNFVHIRIGRDARYNGFNLTHGRGLSRNQIHAELTGEGGDCTINGINLLSGKQHADTTITIEHQAPHCTSNQFYRSVLADEAHGVFQGKVHVHKIAQKTDGYQLANTLLLSELAQMDTKPELEIYADDVKCSHGSTTGQLDEDPLFYMQARGIPEAQARQMLIQAFLAEVIEKVPNEMQAELCRSIITEWLDGHANA